MVLERRAGRAVYSERREVVTASKSGKLLPNFPLIGSLAWRLSVLWPASSSVKRVLS